MVRRFSCGPNSCKVSKKSRRFGSFRKSRRRFGNYQSKVNDLTGALGPTDTAFWPDLGPVKNPWSLAAQPLYFSGPEQRYMISPDVNADKLSVMSFGTKDNNRVLKNKYLSRIAFHPYASENLGRALSRRYPGQFERPRTKKAHHLAKDIEQDINDYRHRFKPEIKDYLESAFKLRYQNRFGTREINPDFDNVKDYVHQNMYRTNSSAKKMYRHLKNQRGYYNTPIRHHSVKNIMAKFKKSHKINKNMGDAIRGLYKLKGL